MVKFFFRKVYILVRLGLTRKKQNYKNPLRIVYPIQQDIEKKKKVKSRHNLKEDKVTHFSKE